MLENIKATTAETADTIVSDSTKLFPEVLKLVKNMPGGVTGLLKQFQDKGLGNVSTSLIARGVTQTITPQQIVHGLGIEKIEGLATASGLDTKIVRKELVTILPKVVAQLAPAEKVLQSRVETA